MDNEKVHRHSQLVTQCFIKVAYTTTKKKLSQLIGWSLNLWKLLITTHGNYYYSESDFNECLKQFYVSKRTNKCESYPHFNFLIHETQLIFFDGDIFEFYYMLFNSITSSFGFWEYQRDDMILPIFKIPCMKN